MKRSNSRHGSIGTVSHGTMRPEDLIPAFLDAASYLRLRREDVKLVRQIDKARESDDYYVLDVEGSGTSQADEDLDVLFDMLDTYSPPFCYFGANEGDGADYGWWPISVEDIRQDPEVWEDDGKARDSEGFATSAPMPKGKRFRLVVSDHGNVSLYYANGREVWSVV